MTDHEAIPRHVWEGIAIDAQMFDCVIRRLIGHPGSALLTFGLSPIVSRFVIESFECLARDIPAFSELFSAEVIEIIRHSRHRSKLLLDRDRDLTEVTTELRNIAIDHRKALLEPHRKRRLYWLVKLLQADLGIFRYEGSIFSTTHAVEFGFGDVQELGARAREFGKAIGSFVSILSDVAKSAQPESRDTTALPGAVTMTDIKYQQLYSRGALGQLELGYSAACVTILASCNFVNRVMRACACSDLGYFKVKFLTAYHAQASLSLIQNVARPAGQFPVDSATIVESLISSDTARWLKGRSRLRNLLTHYRADGVEAESTNLTYREIVESLLGNRSLIDADRALDQYLDLVAFRLESGFRLDKSTFRLGEVK